MKPVLTEQSRLKRLEAKWDNADKWVKRVIGAITTLGVIAGMFVGMFNWGIGKLDGFVDSKIASISSQVSTLESKLDENSYTSAQSRTRLELNMLISHNPTNIFEIEKVARYYFIDLGGDWYMSQIYSDWAKEYGGDLTFVTHQ